MGEENKPKVTVIVPNYNHAQFLPERLESVLGQTYRNLEVIFLDDCSPDNSREILDRYAANDPRVQLVYNEHNSGSTFKQWNKGLAMASGTYVWIAESDDAADLTMLEQLVARLEQNPNAVLAYCQSYYIDTESKKLGVAMLLDDGFGKEDYCISGKELVRKYMPITNVVPNASAVLMRRSAVIAVEPAPEDMRLAGDWLFWIRLMLRGDVCYIATPLNLFRSHGQNVRSQTLIEGLNLIEMARVLGYLRRTITLEPKVYQQALAMLTERWFQTFIYSPLTWRGHKRFMQEMQLFEPSFNRKFIRLLASRLFQNKLGGFKMLIGDKIFV